MKAETRQKSLVIPLRLSIDLVEAIDRAARQLNYSSRNRLIREAIQRFVDETLRLKITEVRDVPVDEAIKMIDDYLARNSGSHYVSEIAEALGLELRTAFQAAQQLMKEGLVEVGEE